MQLTCHHCHAALRVRDEFAGRKMKCPGCQAVLTIPESESAGGESAGASPSLAAGKTKPCPACGKRVLLSAKICRFCKANLTAADEGKETANEKEKKKKKPSPYKPCPRCGATGAKQVKWTAWGSFYGPRLLTHVRCPKCKFGYNGKTGRSNMVPAIACVAVPVAGILALIAWIASVFRERGYFDL